MFILVKVFYFCSQMYILLQLEKSQKSYRKSCKIKSKNTRIEDLKSIVTFWKLMNREIWLSNEVLWEIIIWSIIKDLVLHRNQVKMSYDLKVMTLSASYTLVWPELVPVSLPAVQVLWLQFLLTWIYSLSSKPSKNDSTILPFKVIWL